LLVYLNGILALRKEAFRTIRRKAQGSGHMDKICLEPYAICLEPDATLCKQCFSIPIYGNLCRKPD
jgi:hypothetical protein